MKILHDHILSQPNSNSKNVKRKKEVKISTAYKLGKNVLCTLLAARPAFRMLLVIGALIKLNNKLVGFAFIACELQMLNCGIHCTNLGIKQKCKLK